MSSMDTGELGYLLEAVEHLPARTVVRVLSTSGGSAVVQDWGGGPALDCSRSQVATGTTLTSLTGPAPF